MSKDSRGFSVIMTAYDQAHELEANLPVYLTQHYEPGYEVIVIDESSSDETSDVLKLLKNEYSNLYTTFLPKPDCNKKRKMQAYNLGIKAAKNDWLIFSNISNKPVSNDILQAISDTMNSASDLTLGYLYKKGIKLQTFDSYLDAKDHIIRIERQLHKVRNHKYKKFFMGRYDFIIVRKDVAFDVIKLFELSPSFIERQCMRWRIFWKNLMSSYERITYLPQE